MANLGNNASLMVPGSTETAKPPPDAASLNRDTFIFTVCKAGSVLPVLLGTKGQSLLLPGGSQAISELWLGTQ